MGNLLWKQQFKFYSVAISLNQKSQKTQVTVFMTYFIGSEAVWINNMQVVALIINTSIYVVLNRHLHLHWQKNKSVLKNV